MLIPTSAAFAAGAVAVRPMPTTAAPKRSVNFRTVRTKCTSCRDAALSGPTLENAKQLDRYALFRSSKNFRVRAILPSVLDFAVSSRNCFVPLPLRQEAAKMALPDTRGLTFPGKERIQPPAELWHAPCSLVGPRGEVFA